MKINEAIEILEHFQIWRRGEVDEQKYTPKELGIAIDEILKFTRQKTEKQTVENLIENEIFNKFGYKFNDLKTISRRKEYKEARQIAMYLLRNNTNFPLMGIGDVFNRRHATVMHANKVIGVLIESDDRCLTKYDRELVKDIKQIQKNIDEQLQA